MPLPLLIDRIAQGRRVEARRHREEFCLARVAAHGTPEGARAVMGALDAAGAVPQRRGGFGELRRMLGGE